MDYINTGIRLASDPAQASWIGPLLIAGDAVLSAGIIAKIPYTEIDWRAYMQQVEQYIKGERDYAQIRGDTGPLVYPGLHVYIYRALYSLTDSGKDILAGQVIFAGLYLASLAVVMSVYRKAKVPPYVYPLLILSKRLHSIYMLRLFNDCFTTLFIFSAIRLYQSHKWNIGTVLFTCALGVKMNVLLVVPALAFVFLQGLGVDRSITQALIVAQSQGAFAYEFVRRDYMSYLSRAFQLNRAFIYKWTVNWRFVPEEIFLSKSFSYSLLAIHAGLLLLFAFTRWTKPSQRTFSGMLTLYFSPSSRRNTDLFVDITDTISDRVTPEFITTSILTANAIGMLCARSLHYQFYSWLAWSTPFLLWRSGLHPVLIYVVWGAQEWGWNVYPSTDTSSAVVVGCLAVQVLGVWWGTRKESLPIPKKEKK